MVGTKGQAATEYLIIVSIVVVVALIAVSTVSGFPSLLGGASKTRSSDFWNRADISITAYTLFADGSSVMLVKNRKGYEIEVKRMELGGSAVPLSMKLFPGEVKKVEIPRGTLKGGAGGDAYSEKVAFRYADAEQPEPELSYAPDVPLAGNYE